MDKKKYADIHIHLLYGVDDGAVDEREMYEILDAAYADGSRVICATPHFHPVYFGDNISETQTAFDALKLYAGKYDDLQLYSGNELRYSQNCIEFLKNGTCRTLNGTKYVLVDFLENDGADYIVSSVLKLLNAGYIPVLAHAERYAKFHSDCSEIRFLKEHGAVIQVDAQSPFGGWGYGSKIRSRKILKLCLADVVASDAHDTSYRPPQMGNCYDYVSRKCGEEYAKLIFWDNPIRIVEDKDIERAC